MSARSDVAGLLLVDKPAGLSSHDVVGIVRRAVRHKRVGHAGTLDPFATGLLVVAVGKVTRLLPYIAGEPKVYEATIAFGEETDTDDATGLGVRRAPLPAAATLCDATNPDRLLAEALLTGTIEQMPPAYSAKHVDGQRAYERARKGLEVALKPVPVTVHRWEWLRATTDTLTVRITCGGGTYIRALARDLGRLLGSAAHCQSLRRVSSGAASVEQAVSLAQLEPGSVAEGTVSLVSPLSLLEAMAHEALDAVQVADLRFGRAVAASTPGARAALLQDGDVVAIADRTSGNRWQPRVVLLETAT